MGSGREPKELQQGRVTGLMDNYGFLALPAGEALFHRRGVGEPWGFEDFKIGDKVVCTTIEVRMRAGDLKLRAYDVRILDPKRRPAR